MRIIKTKSIHTAPESSDGLRVFVERFWPEHLKKEKAHVDFWFKIISPSAELGKWFEANQNDWDSFKEKYSTELNIHKKLIEKFLTSESKEPTTLLFSVGTDEKNAAIVVKEYLERTK